MKDLESIEGTVEEVIYTNAENGYTVCALSYDKIYITAVGYMPGLAAGEKVKFTGNFTVHPEYGEQFKVLYFEKLLPRTESAILAYLSSGIIKGVRAATAAKIVAEFGENTLAVIRNDPAQLTVVSGISMEKARKISESFLEQQAMQEIVLFLQQYGVKPDMAVKVQKTLGDGAIAQIQKNPYVLCKKVHGIGFKTADEIAMRMDFDKNTPQRIEAGLQHALAVAAQNEGHTFLPKKELVAAASALLHVSRDAVEQHMTGMVLSDVIICEGERCFHPSFYHAENGIARQIHSLLSAKNENYDDEIERGIAQAEEESGIALSDEQKQAVHKSIYSGVHVITGGPGTGKTTIIKTILHIFALIGKEVALTAPTGRAAKHMGQMCGKDAKTIHRLLEIGYVDEDEIQRFARDESNPLDASVVIVDEVSMVDVFLMHSLLKALKPGTRLVLVGDVDQLPSVGAGNVLKDIIASGVAEVSQLNHIYRQAAQSMIVVNAHKINKGEMPAFNIKEKDFFFVKRDGQAAITQTVLELAAQRLPKSYGYNPKEDIQILTPVKKTFIGTENLNRQLQQVINPPEEGKQERQSGNFVFREGDKVMQMKNNYSLAWKKKKEEGTGVFNGDIGYIKKIDPAERLVTILFDDGREVTYDGATLPELEPAYAITIHKSQGSEFPCIVVPMYMASSLLMTRNLLYTAVTRAKELVVLVGEYNAVYKMVNNNTQANRYSMLCERLQAL